jgi:hypothetical protein
MHFAILILLPSRSSSKAKRVYRTLLRIGLLLTL